MLTQVITRTQSDVGNQGGMWEIGRKKITTEYEKLLSLICFVIMNLQKLNRDEWS